MNERTVAIIQSNYVPWKGYFDLIRRADELILLDSVQYTKNDWRNRNRIKTPTGLSWLTIPVKFSGRFGSSIDSIEIADRRWARQHWRKIEQNYRGAAQFREWGDRVRSLYEEAGEPLLSRVNERLIRTICGWLGIVTRISRDTDYELGGERSERLVGLCRQVGATEYVSGPAARAYLDESLFTAAGIRVSWMSYTGYPEYPQIHPPFRHEVSILDVLLNAGSQAAALIAPRQEAAA